MRPDKAARGRQHRLYYRDGGAPERIRCEQVRYARRLYRLTTPRTIKIRTINSEFKVKIPQMSVTLLLRTAASSLLKCLATRLAFC